MRRLLSAVLVLAALPVFGQQHRSISDEVMANSPSVYLKFNDKSGGFKDQASGQTFTAAGTGATLYAQAGQSGDLGTAASLTYNAPVTAPNTTLGDFEWTHPFSIYVHLDSLSFIAGGATRMELVTKGALTGDLLPDQASSSTIGWALYLSQSGSGGRTVPEFTMVSNTANVGFDKRGIAAATGGVIQQLANTYGYDVVVTYDGTGTPAGINMWINGQLVATTATEGSKGGFGAVSTAITGTGSGYANSTAFTSSGGGANCSVTGTMTSVSGVPSGVSYTTNHGCTSLPTLALTAPTGTGVTLTPTLLTTSLSNSYPLVVNGDANNVISAQGIHNSGVNLFNEVAVFPSVLSNSAIENFFAHTGFYQQVIGAKPSSPQRIIWTNDGCADTDNHWSLATAIALHRLGYIRLIAVLDSVSSNQSMVNYRQVLDAAGLGHVPVGQGATLALTGATGNSTDNFCTTTNSLAYNATQSSSWPTGVTVLRQALAASPDASVVIVNGGGLQHIYDLLVSAADGYSALTGQALFNAKVTAMYSQSGNGTGSQAGDNITQGTTSGSFNTSAGAYYLTHNGTVPYYAYGGGLTTFPSTGPGASFTRSSKDPFGTDIYYWQNTTVGYVLAQRTGYDSMPMIGAIPALQSMFFTTGTNGTYTISTTAMSYSSGTASNHYPMSANLTTYDVNMWQMLIMWTINSLTDVQPTNTRPSLF